MSECLLKGIVSCFPVKRTFFGQSWFSMIKFYMHSSEQSFKFLTILKNALKNSANLLQICTPQKELNHIIIPKVLTVVDKYKKWEKVFYTQNLADWWSNPHGLLYKRGICS